MSLLLTVAVSYAVNFAIVALVGLGFERPWADVWRVGLALAIPGTLVAVGLQVVR